ncbi:MAG: calcium-binding protein [Pseudomonadota bacterium]
MTAYTINGYLLIENPGDQLEPFLLTDSTLVISDFDDVGSISYRPDPSFQGDIAFNFADGFAVYLDGLNVTGLASTEGPEVAMEVIRLERSPTDTILLGIGIEDIVDGVSVTYAFIYSIGGAPLPILTNFLSFAEFLVEEGGELVEIGEGQPFGAFQPIPLAGFAGVEGTGLMTADAVTILGTDVDDLLTGDDGQNIFRPGLGNDTVLGLGGGDTILGVAGDDSMHGGAGNDFAMGGKGKDTLSGGAGDDTVLGGAAADVVEGRTGDDRLSGGQGADTVLGGAGDDTLRGEIGNDELNGGAGNDLIFGGKKADTLIGGAGDDTLHGQRDDDLVMGWGGNDLLTGERGRDTLNGGAGNDTVDGGTWRDTLEGGAGSDTFVFGLGYGQDVIVDFEDDTDTIRLASDLAQGLAGLTGADIIETYGRPARPGNLTDNLVLDFGGDELEISVMFSDRAQVADDIEVF